MTEWKQENSATYAKKKYPWIGPVYTCVPWPYPWEEGKCLPYDQTPLLNGEGKASLADDFQHIELMTFNKEQREKIKKKMKQQLRNLIINTTEKNSIEKEDPNVAV